MTEVPIPEVPTIAAARIVEHPASGRDCLLVETDGGEKVAFGFEVESDSPGLSIVDPGLWLAAAGQESPDHSRQGLEAVEDAWADDWLQALVAHPVASEWLNGIKREHAEAYHRWFAQTQYEEGGEEGAG